MAYNAGVELMNAGDKAGRRSEVPRGRDEEPRPAAGLAGADDARVREEGLGARARVRPEGDGPRPDDDAALPDDGGRRRRAGRQEGRGGMARRSTPRRNPDTPEILYNKGVEALNTKKMKEAADFFAQGRRGEARLRARALPARARVDQPARTTPSRRSISRSTSSSSPNGSGGRHGQRAAVDPEVGADPRRRALRRELRRAG